MNTNTATPANTGLTSKALLVNVSISQWSGRKHDKKVTREVEEAHNAQSGEAGRFNKMLTSKEFLAATSKAAGAARQYLYDNTLPWGDNGDRLLPSANYFDFVNGMNKLQSDFYSHADTAENSFDEELNNAKVRLNGLFNSNDYPNRVEFRSKFAFKVCFMPIAEAEDIRLDINQTEINVLKQSIESEMNNRLSASVADIWDRIKEQLQHMKDRLTSTTKDKENNEVPVTFRNSLFSNLADLVTLLPKLNITGSPEITAICEDMRGLLIDPDKVRESATIRSRKADEVNAILNKFDAFFS